MYAIRRENSYFDRLVKIADMDFIQWTNSPRYFSREILHRNIDILLKQYNDEDLRAVDFVIEMEAE